MPVRIAVPLTDLSGVLFEKATVARCLKKLPTFYGIWGSLRHPQEFLHRQTNPVHTLPPCSFALHFIILPATPVSTMWTLSFTSPEQYYESIFYIYNEYYTSSPSYFPLFHRTNNTRGEIQIAKLLNTQCLNVDSLCLSTVCDYVL